MKKFTVTLVLCLSLALPSFCVDTLDCGGDIPELSEGMGAYKRGDYQKAERIFVLRFICYIPLDDHAAFMLGLMALLGKGTKHIKNSQPDYSLALRMFLEAAKYEHRLAMYQIGFIYLRGKGVPQNYKEAAKWFRKSIEKKYAPAMTALGLMHYLGDGAIQSKVMAHMWYNLASAYGDKKANKLRDELAEYMTNDQIAEAQSRALEWMEKKK